MTERSPYSPFGLIHLALDNARLLIAVPLGAAVVAVLLALLMGGEYAAQSTFKPQSEQSDLSRMSGLAAQFGIEVPGAAARGGESVAFYVRLARSRALLEAVALRQYRIRERGGEERRGTLIQLYRIRGGSEVERRRNAVDLLARQVIAEPDLNAGVVEITTRAPSAELAEQLNRAILDELNRFNLERRQSQASAERRFVEAQVARSQRDLAQAETELGTFMEHNRRYEEWPQLRFEAQRLQRRVDLQQQVYTGLVQALQRARLDEVRNTPVLTVIDYPEGSARRHRGLVQKAVLGGLLGIMLVVAFLFLRLYARRLSEQYPEEFARVRLRQPWLAALLLTALFGCARDGTGPVFNPAAVVQVSAGARHTCGLTDTGDVYCWGAGTDGQLGSGYLANTDLPVKVASSVPFSAVTAGGAHSCALSDQGLAYCWGWNSYYQRGNATDTATARPVAVTGGRQFTAIDAGGNHTCALTADGAAWCWGFNRFGQLGDGTTNTSIEPVRVVGGIAFQRISAGANHTCATANDGLTYCWGLNSDGQLGVGADTVLATTPLAVTGALRFQQLAAGFDHTCGSAAGVLYCWGGNSHGQLANGAAFPEGLPGASTPTRTASAQGIGPLAAGYHTTCGLDGSQAYCWGRGDSGQLGDGATGDEYLPQAVHLLPAKNHTSDRLAFRTITVGSEHTCGTTIENAVFCWGSGREGQLGNPNTPTSLLPVRVRMP